jgi:hypothetical protein
VDSLSRLTRPQAKAEIDHLTRELGAARAAARVAQDKAISIGFAAQHLKTQANQSSRAKVAVNAKAESLAKALAVIYSATGIDSLDLDRIY